MHLRVQLISSQKLLNKAAYMHIFTVDLLSKTVRRRKKMVYITMLEHKSERPYFRRNISINFITTKSNPTDNVIIRLRKMTNSITRVNGISIAIIKLNG